LSKGSLIAEAIDEKHGLGEVVFLGESMKERSSWICPVRSEQIDTQNQLGVEVYCSVQRRPLAIDLDSGFVYGDPLRLRLRRVRNAVSYSMYPLKDCLMRALNAK